MQGSVKIIDETLKKYLLGNTCVQLLKEKVE